MCVLWFLTSFFSVCVCVCIQDVDQISGRDLNPVVNRMLAGGEVKETNTRNPDRYCKSCTVSICVENYVC